MTKTKELTLILPDSVEIIDMTYYWREKNGKLIKSCVFTDGKNVQDGNKINCYKPIEESEET